MINVAFSLALFSIPERALLGLLNDRQYENMKTEFPDGFSNHLMRYEEIIL